MDARPSRLRPQTRQELADLRIPLGWRGESTERRDPVRTFETPLVMFPAEILIGNNFEGQVTLPANCAQIVFLDVIPGVAASLNGGGGRTIKDGFAYNGLFQSLYVVTDATGQCTIQTAGF
jgi:hypothetical protein